MIAFFKLFIYTPLYNLLILILNVSWIDAGLAAIILTIIVKAILYPLAKKSTITQIKMRENEPKLALIKEKYKDRQEQALKVMEFYRENNIKPFSSILTIIIQIPIIYSLYYIFLKSGLPGVDSELLYSFIKAPQDISMNFLGFVDVSQKSFVLALLAAISAFFQMHLASPSTDTNGTKKVASNPEDFSKMMAKQMKYTMPIIVLFISWKISGVIALYWFVSNLFGILQDLYIKRQLKLSK